jgi:hypothetical protein
MKNNIPMNNVRNRLNVEGGDRGLFQGIMKVFSGWADKNHKISVMIADVRIRYLQDVK